LKGVDREHARSLAVDGHLDLLSLQGFGKIRADQFTRVVVVEFDAERVVAVSGEVVGHGSPTTRPERCAFDVTHLVGHFGNVELSHDGRRGRIADSLAGDLVGRADISLHQGGGDGQGVGHVVKIAGPAIGREQRIDIDVDVEQVPNGVTVLPPVDPV